MIEKVKGKGSDHVWVGEEAIHRGGGEARKLIGVDPLAHRADRREIVPRAGQVWELRFGQGAEFEL